MFGRIRISSDKLTIYVFTQTKIFVRTNNLISITEKERERERKEKEGSDGEVKSRIY